MSLGNMGSRRLISIKAAPAKLRKILSRPPLQNLEANVEPIPATELRYTVIEENLYAEESHESLLKSHWLSDGDKCACVEECGNSCENRSMMYECDATNCQFEEVQGKACTNRTIASLNGSDRGVEVIMTPCGYGLRTSHHLTVDQLIGEYVGTVTTKFRENDNSYYMAIGRTMYRKKVWLDAQERGNIFRFVNSSCDPNCRIVEWEVEGKPRVGIFANQDIPKMTELTLNYPVRDCKCSSENCHRQSNDGDDTEDEDWEKIGAVSFRDEEKQDDKYTHSDFLKKPHSKFVTFLVGADEVPFSIQKDIVCAQSPFYCEQSATMEQSRLGLVSKLPDTDVEAFGCLQTFIYTGEVHNMRRFGFSILLRVWKLAKKLMMAHLQTNLVNYMTVCVIPSLYDIKEAWGCTETGCPLRVKLIGWIVEYMNDCDKAAELAELLPKEALIEICRAMIRPPVSSTPSRGKFQPQNDRKRKNVEEPSDNGLSSERGAANSRNTMAKKARKRFTPEQYATMETNYRQNISCQNLKLGSKPLAEIAKDMRLENEEKRILKWFHNRRQRVGR